MQYLVAVVATLSALMAVAFPGTGAAPTSVCNGQSRIAAVTATVGAVGNPAKVDQIPLAPNATLLFSFYNLVGAQTAASSGQYREEITVLSNLFFDPVVPSGGYSDNGSNTATAIGTVSVGIAATHTALAHANFDARVSFNAACQITNTTVDFRIASVL